MLYLREHDFRFYNNSKVVTKIYCTLKNRRNFKFDNFFHNNNNNNFIILGGHILNILRTTFLKLIFHLQLSCQFPDVLWQKFYIH